MPIDFRTIPEHWATIAPLLNQINFSGFVTGDDRWRLGAYDLYDWIYWTREDSFKLLMRGQEGVPVLIPSGRSVVETAQRYAANDLAIIADPLFGTEAQRTAGMGVLTDFIRRERLYSKFSANKRNGLKRGDWLWHITADDTRPDGTRLSINALHPGTFFPEFDETDPSQMIAVHLVEAVAPFNGKPAVRKLTYAKTSGTGGPSTIALIDGIYAGDSWGQPGTDMKDGMPLQLDTSLVLPDSILSFPVYHIANGLSDDDWGYSEMAGIERLMAAINQGITDEELALVLEGLGVYWTDSGSPVDEETGDDEPWTLGPGRVVEVPKGGTFGRVSGNGSIQPYMDHLRYLHDQIDEATGTSDVTRGRADVQVAESGIALSIRMAPLIARMTEKELIVTDVMTNMLFDLRGWFAAYEPTLASAVDPIRWLPTYGSKIPTNRAEQFKNIIDMYTATPVPIISGVEARLQLSAIGFNFSADDTEMLAQIIQEQSNFAAQMASAGLPAALAPPSTLGA